ncbi:MAG: ribosome maturation factor RimP [Bdellovibrionota bacterium]
MIYKSPKELELIEKLGSVVSSLNYELRDIDIRQGKPALVRITIDIQDRSRGVTLDDCYEVHQAIDPLFDVWDPLQMAYTLEVSSPGEKAPLRSREHFDEAVGSEIEFRTREAVKMPENPTAAPRKNWKGKLLAVVGTETDLKVKLEDSMGTHEVEASLIEGARWIRDWSAKDKKENKL